MTSIYIKEERECIYQSEKPFPHIDDKKYYIPVSDRDRMLFSFDREHWFKNSKRIVVKEGEEVKFHTMIYRAHDKLKYINEFDFLAKEGVEIPSSCYRVEEKCDACDAVSLLVHCNPAECKFKKSVAVFVDSVPHAKGKETLWIKEMNNACDKYGMPNVGSVQFNKMILDYFNPLPPPPNDKP